MQKGIFPNLNYTVASYSPVTTFISFETIKEKDWSLALGASTTYKHAENKGIIHHETRHYVDHISTVWGQTNLLLLYKALNARLALDEYKFTEIIKYKKQERELHFAEYYHEVYNAHVWKTGSPNWEYQFSSGFRYTDTGSPDQNRPIMFVRFRTEDGKSLSRVPLSIASLLESNAVFQEVSTINNYVSAKGTAEEKKKFNAWLMGSLIYNNDRTLYNVAVHITANLLEIYGPMLAFQICSAVATLTLNLPYNLVINLPVKNKEMEVWNNRPQDMLHNQEYGFIFFNLLNNYRDQFKLTGKFILKELLDANQLPNESAIFEMAKKEIIDIGSGFDGLNLNKYFSDLHQKGQKLYGIRRLEGNGYSISKILSSEDFMPSNPLPISMISFLAISKIADSFGN